jgi:hypothetical protein
MLTGLEPGRTYYYRLVAVNTSGSRAEGAILTVSTPPLPDADADGLPDEREAPGCKDVPRGSFDTDPQDGCPDDRDRDGLLDEREAPACVSIPRGTIDKNGDGCPDNSDKDALIDEDDECDFVTARPAVDRRPRNGCPDVVLAERPKFGYDVTGLPLGKTLFDKLKVRVEKGARVRLRCARACRLSQLTKPARKTGYVTLTKALRRRLDARVIFTITVTKPGLVSVVYRMVWKDRALDFAITKQCIPVGKKTASRKACKG